MSFVVDPEQLLCSLPQLNVWLTQDFCTSSEMEKVIELISCFSHLDIPPCLSLGSGMWGAFRPEMFALKPLSKLSLWRHQTPESQFFPSSPLADFSKGRNCSSISFFPFQNDCIVFSILSGSIGHHSELVQSQGRA